MIGLSRLTEITFALVRFVLGLLYACHGAQKLLGMFGGRLMSGSPLILTAGVIELGCGTLIAVGLLTRVAAFLASGEMALAYFKMHAPRGFWPIVNKGELAVAFCFAFLFIAAHGAGAYSLGRAIGRR